MKVLVAYASKYGATAGIAHRIGDTLQRHGSTSMSRTAAPSGRRPATTPT